MTLRYLAASVGVLDSGLLYFYSGIRIGAA